MPKFTLKTYLKRTDLLVLIFFFIAVSAVFVIPALLNRPLMPGDDVIQNFPLRLFSGDQIASGHLPLWNPFGFSGTPLLAGFNAGSIYPTTLLFAVLPPIAAWVINEITAYFVAVAGIYILLRCYRFSITVSLISSICFIGSGMMAIQLPHIDLIQAISFMPWLLIVLGSMTSKMNQFKPEEHKTIYRSMSGEIFLSSILWGLIFLTGSTRAITDDLIIYVIFMIYIVFPRPGTHSNINNRCFIQNIPNHTRNKMRLMMGLALAMGLLLSSLQDGPGLIFISESQRSSASIGLFNQSSPYVGWMSMLFVPGILGTAQSLKSPGFFGDSVTNIVEVSGYIGLLATLGFFEFSIRHRKYKERFEFLNPFFYIGAIGIFLTYIAGNLFGGLMIHIPIYGIQRIQGRNLLEVDFAFTFFMAFMIEQITQSKAKLKVARYLCILTLIFIIIAIAYPVKVTEIVGTSVTPYASATHLRPWYLAAMVVDLLILLLLFTSAKNSRVNFKLAATVILIVVDVALYNLNSVITIDTGKPQTPTVQSNLMTILRKTNNGENTNATTINRFVIYDPYVYPAEELVNINWPDINVITQKFSAQGYQSLSLDNYDSLTSTHGNMVLDPKDFTSGIFKLLGVTKAYSPPQNFNSDYAPTPDSYPTSSTNKIPSSWYFGEPTTLESFKIKVDKCSIPKIYLINTKGELVNVNRVNISCENNALSVLQYNKTSKFVGIYIKGTYGSNHITQIPPIFYSYESFNKHYLNAPLSNQLYYPNWKYVSTVDNISLYTEKADGFLRTYPTDSKITAATLSNNGTLNFNIDAKRPTLVIVNQTFAPGFNATAQSLNGSSRLALKINQDNPIQMIEVPKGNWHITVSYMPFYIKYYIADEILAGFLISILGLIYLRRKIRHRRLL